MTEQDEFEFRLRLEKERGAAPANKPKVYDPIKDFNTSGVENFMAGAGKAVADTWRGLSGLVAPALDKIAPRQQTLTSLVTGKKVLSRAEENSADVAESRQLDAPLMSTGAGFSGNLAGNVGMAMLPGGALKGAGVAANALRAPGAAASLSAAGGALIAPTTIKGAAALGGGIGLAQPALDMDERVRNAGLGALAGGAGTAAVSGLSRVIRPQTAPGVNALMAEGVTPTPGQILGGSFKRAEEGLTSVPIVGDAIKRGQLRAVTDLNTAAYNRALAPIGDKLPKGMQGREAVSYVEEKLGARYDTLLPKLTTEMDPELLTGVQKLQGMMSNGSIDPAKASQFESLLQNQVLAKFQRGANGAPTLTGQTMKGIETDLGQLSSKFRRSPDPDQQMVGDALQELQSMLRDAVMRNNPQFAPELKKINEGWANFKRVQKAAAGVGADDGVFSAAQLQSAVKATDRSKDKGAFARGNALMQDLSETGKGVLGPKVPDSGTPYRSMAALLAGSGTAGMTLGPGAAAAVLAGPAMYSRLGQNALAALLTKRPDSAVPVANALRRLGPAAAVPLAVDTTTRRQ